MIKIPRRHLCQVKEAGIVLSVDIGFSLVKVGLYNNTNENNDVDVKLTKYTREQISSIHNYLNKNCSGNNVVSLTLSGADSAWFMDQLASWNLQQLDLKSCSIKIVDNNFASSVKTFRYLLQNNLPQITCGLPFSDSNINEFEELEKSQLESLMSWTQHEDNSDTKDLDNIHKDIKNNSSNRTDQYPALIVSIESAQNNFIKVNENGSFQHVLVRDDGFDSLLGLARLLCNIKDVEDFFRLSELGDASSVDTYMRDMAGVGQSDVYSVNRNYQCPIYFYGNLVGRQIADFNREDLASATLINYCQDVMDLTLPLATLHNINSIYFIGTPLEHEHLRRSLMVAFLRKFGFTILKDRDHVIFPKYSSYFGTFGFLINDEACF